MEMNQAKQEKGCNTSGQAGFEWCGMLKFFICTSFTYICMGCFESSPFSQRTQRSNGFVGRGGAEVSVRFPDALGGSQDSGPGVQWGEEMNVGEQVRGSSREAAAPGCGLKDLTGPGCFPEAGTTCCTLPSQVRLGQRA